MSLNKQTILAALEQEDIQFDLFEHEEVLTVEAMSKVLADVGAPAAKNLFLKDKRNRLYVVTALPDTKIDLKGLSARLGTGKGGVRMASDELLQSVLQVPLGAVTPLAVCQPTALNVILLLDARLKEVERFCIHPLVNTASIAVSAEGLEKMLISQGSKAMFVDFVNAPVIDNEHPPDLKDVADIAQPFDTVAEVAPSASPVQSQKTSRGKKEAKNKSNPGSTCMLCDDPLAMTESLITKIGSAGVVEDATIRQLKADIEMEIVSFRNAAYTRGYLAAKNQIAQQCNPSI